MAVLGLEMLEHFWSLVMETLQTWKQMSLEMQQDCGACRAREVKAKMRALVEDAEIIKPKRKWLTYVGLLVIIDVFV